jgi:hypothetical protein
LWLDGYFTAWHCAQRLDIPSLHALLTDRQGRDNIVHHFGQVCSFCRSVLLVSTECTAIFTCDTATVHKSVPGILAPISLALNLKRSFSNLSASISSASLRTLFSSTEAVELS